LAWAETPFPLKTLYDLAKRSTSVLLLLSSLWLLDSLSFVPVVNAKDSCVECHRELEEELAAPVEGMKVDIHTRQGLSCVSCHGGDPTNDDPEGAMDPRKGYLGAPTAEKIPTFCGNCHSNAEYMRRFNPSLRVDQLQLYWTSVHGEQLARGDTRVANCVSCHGVHGILPASDPRSPVYPVNVPGMCAKCHADPGRMRVYGIPMNQMGEYKTSVHGVALLEKGDLAAPACNDCHGNHGATPPGVSSVANVCSQCHPANGEFLAGSPHAQPFEEMGIAACETCHGNHRVERPTDEMLGTGKGSTCITCHDKDSGGYVAAAAIKGAIEGLKMKRDEAARLITRAETAGMEVSSAKFDLHEVDGTLTLARTKVHTFALSQVEEVTAKGMALAENVRKAGEKALAELQFRRKGLGVSLVIIIIVAVALAFKIREIDRRKTFTAEDSGVGQSGGLTAGR
jgi:hypothetical protein